MTPRSTKLGDPMANVLEQDSVVAAAQRGSAKPDGVAKTVDEAKAATTLPKIAPDTWRSIGIAGASLDGNKLQLLYQL